MKRKLFCLILAICCMASLLCGCSNFSLDGLSGLLGGFGGSEEEIEQQVPDIPSDEDIFEEGNIHIIIPSDGEEDESDKPNKVIIIRPSDEDEKVEKPDTPVSNKQESSKEEPKKEEKPQKEESKPESSKPSKAKHALPAGAAGTWVFENASGDGEEVVREEWTFTEWTDIVIDGYYCINAHYRAYTVNSKGEYVGGFYDGTFDFRKYEDGLFYFNDAEIQLEPFTIEVVGDELLIKAFQYIGNPQQRYFRRG